MGIFVFDEFEKTIDENNELISLKIISSYYKDNKFIGKSFIKSGIDTALNVYHKETLQYYIDKFVEII